MKYIQTVIYRHLGTAYLKIIGRTKLEALRNAKRVGTYLEDKLSSDAYQLIPRYKGEDEEGQHVYEVPVMAGLCMEVTRPILAEIVLRGSV